MQLVSGMKRGMGSQAAFVLVCDGVARLIDLPGRERGALDLGDGHHKPAFTDERDRDGRGLYFDSPVTPAHVEGRPRLQAGLAADVFRDDQPPRRIYGCFHAVNSTTLPGIRTMRQSVALRRGACNAPF